MKVPKFLQPFEQVITECAAAGMSKHAICRKLHIGDTTFGKYEVAREWFDRGREQLAELVTKSIVKASNTSYLDRKLLAEKLNLFSEPFEVKRITTPAQARTLIATGISKYCAGEITEISLNTITKSALAFIESYNQTVLQKDLADIKKQLAGRK